MIGWWLEWVQVAFQAFESVRPLYLLQLIKAFISDADTRHLSRLGYGPGGIKQVISTIVGQKRAILLQSVV